MWFKKKILPASKPASKVIVYVKSGRTISLSCRMEGKNGMYFPWRSFLKWYHSRPQSSSYTFKHRRGAKTVLRGNITGFEIEVIRDINP